MASKRKFSATTPIENDVPVDPTDELMFLCLGGGNEVGRSSHIIQYKGKTVMLDAGMHPGYEGLASLPFYDEFDLSTVDVLLISHFHIDHAASLPYVLARTNFRGRVFMTHPTKAIYKWLIQDTVRVSNIHSSSEQRTQLYTEADHLSTFPQIETIDYHTTHTISSIRITPYPAGHVLGAAMFLIEIAGLKMLFTGDFSREEDRHLIAASVPRNVKIDVLICESTFGIGAHMPRAEREAALTRSISSVIGRGGRVLLPCFALGTAQELLLILDEYWSRHQELHNVPIYFTSTLARKCMVVYQTYVDSMNDNIKRMVRERMSATSGGDEGSSAVMKRGPWDFRFVRSLKSLDRFDDVGSCVMLASPGMMQSGASRQLLERWAPDARNGVIITGYSVEGTMGKQILNEPDTIQAIMTRNTGQGARSRGPSGKEGEPVMIPRRCTVQEYSFAAHVDGVQNRDFIEEVAAPVVILVHGEKNNMMRLKSKLLSLNTDKAIPAKIYSPANCEELRIPFRTDKVAKVVGKLAQLTPPSLSRDDREGNGDGGKHVNGDRLDQFDQALISGVLVQNDFKMSLMAPEDLREYAGLATTTVTCHERLTLGAAGRGLIRWALEGTFGSVKEETVSAQRLASNDVHGNATNGDEMETNGVTKHEDEDAELGEEETVFTVMDCVSVRCAQSYGGVDITWEGNMVNDSIADAVLACLLVVETSPAAVKQSSRNGHSHSHAHSPSPSRNPFAHNDPQTRLSRLCLFLESQFGSDAITPISRPRLSSSSIAPSSSQDATSDEAQAQSSITVAAGLADSTSSTKEESTFTPDETQELERLHAMGIPVPGLQIQVDKHVVRVWLENMDVECATSNPLKDRVRAVVGRAAETVAPLWEN